MLFPSLKFDRLWPNLDGERIGGPGNRVSQPCFFFFSLQTIFVITAPSSRQAESKSGSLLVSGSHGA